MSNSDFDIKIYEVVEERGLGRSHLLKKKVDKDGYDLFLFYCEGNNWHYVLCDALFGSKDGCSFSRVQYYPEIETDLKIFENA